jgi:DNA-binding transcriptional MerR regulator
MTIGDFSRATRLSAKALRLYHQAGLLVPARVDPANGYRLYSADQIAPAQFVRHLRSLDVPVDLVREVLAAPAGTRRESLLAGHLARMEAELERTRSAVASLRSLLTTPDVPLTITHRHVPETPALTIRETIDLADLSEWFSSARDELLAVGTGPLGGCWDSGLFLEERGPALLFVPTPGAPEGRVRSEVLPAVDLAVAVHHGSDDTIGEVYAALGEYVSRHGLGAPGPVRETYLREPDAAGIGVTEIGWPVRAGV